MKQKQLDRLLNHRKRIEKRRALVLHEALVEQEKQEQNRNRALESRKQVEEKLRGFEVQVADELRRDHDSLSKANEAIAHIEEELGKANERVQEENNALVEARREVKVVEILMQRLASREADNLKRKEQRSSDELATRKHFEKNN